MKKFIKDVIALQIGNYVLSFIGFMTSVVLARVLHKENYGIYVLVLTLFGLIKDFCFLSAQGTMIRFANAYYRKDITQQIHTLGIFITQSLIFSLFLVILGLLLAEYLGKILYNSAYIGKLTSILILTLPSLYLQDLALLVCQAQRKMLIYTLFENSVMLIRFMIIILFLYLFSKKWPVLCIVLALVIHSIIASIMSLYLYMKQARACSLPPILSLIKKAMQLPLAWHIEFIKFSFKITLAKNLAAFLRKIPLLLLGKFSTSVHAGYFNIVESIYNLANLPISALSQNLSPKFAQSLANSKTLLRKHFFKGLLLALFLSISIFLLFFFAAPWIIYIYGEEYLPGKNLVPIFGILLIVGSLGVGIAPLLRLMNKVEISIKILVFTLVICLPFGILLTRNLHSLGASIYLLLLYTISITIGLLYAIRILYKN